MKLKNLFKRNPKPVKDETAAQGPAPAIPHSEHIWRSIAIPEEFIHEGNLFRFGEDGIEDIPDFRKVIRDMNVKISFAFDPHIDYEGWSYWTITWTPEYSYRGKTSGQNGPKIVEQIGLAFSAETGNVRIIDDGRIEWRTSYFPEVLEIHRMVNDVQAQITDIMKDFFRAEAFIAVKKA